MAEFIYYATFDESIEVVRVLCGTGFEVVPSGPYYHPEFVRYTHATEELVQALKASVGGLYLAGVFTRFPIQFFDSANRLGQYDINPMAQGPVMDGLLARMNLVDGLPTLLSGSVSYDSEGYRNPETNVWEKPSDDLKAAYKQAVAIIKKHAKPYRSGIGIHIAPEARRLLERGEARISYPGFVNPALKAG